MFDDILAAQAGVVSRAQALACGVTDDVIQSHLRSGRWTRLFAGVYATFSGPPPRPAAYWAALLYGGSGAMLSHGSAAEVSGLAPNWLAPSGLASAGSAPGPAGAPVHVTVPAERRVRSVRAVVIHRSRRAARARHPSRVPAQTRIEETVLDLVVSARDLDEAMGWLTRACAGRFTTPERLRSAMAARPRLRCRAELSQVLADVAAGCHSPLELRYLRDVERRHGLPPAQRQRARARRGGRWYDDVYYPGFATVVELDGLAAHPGESRWRDMRRDNAAVAEGEAVLRYGAADVAETATGCWPARSSASVRAADSRWMCRPISTIGRPAAAATRADTLVSAGHDPQQLRARQALDAVRGVIFGSTVG